MVAEYTTIAIQICITATQNAHGGTPPRDTVRKKRSVREALMDCCTLSHEEIRKKK